MSVEFVVEPVFPKYMSICVFVNINMKLSHFL